MSKQLQTPSELSTMDLVLDNGIYRLARERAGSKAKGEKIANLGENDSITSLETYRESFAQLNQLSDRLEIHLIREGIALMALGQLKESSEERFHLFNLANSIYGNDNEIIKLIEQNEKESEHTNTCLVIGGTSLTTSTVMFLLNYFYLNILPNDQALLGPGVSMFIVWLYFLLAHPTGIFGSKVAVEVKNEESTKIPEGVKEFADFLKQVEKIESYLKIYELNPLHKKECAILVEAKQIILALLQSQGHVLNQKLVQGYPLEQIKLRVRENVSAEAKLADVDDLMTQLSAAEEAEDETLEAVFRKLDSKK